MNDVIAVIAEQVRKVTDPMANRFQRWVAEQAETKLPPHVYLFPPSSAACPVCGNAVKPSILHGVACEHCGRRHHHECYWHGVATKAERKAWFECDEKELLAMLIRCKNCRN